MQIIDTTKLELRLNNHFRNALITLRRRTSVPTMNILCRWALCVSLAEPTKPRVIEEKIDSQSNPTEARGIEIRWETFSGKDAEIYLSLLKQRCLSEGRTIDAENIQQTMKQHVERGLGYLVNDVNGLSDLISKAA